MCIKKVLNVPQKVIPTWATGALLHGTPVERYLRLKARKIASSGKLFFGAINERRKPPHWKNGKWCLKL